MTEWASTAKFKMREVKYLAYFFSVNKYSVFVFIKTFFNRINGLLARANTLINFAEFSSAVI